MSKKLLSFLLIACMLSSNMAVPASYAQTVNDGTANPNLEVTQDSAKSDDKVEAQGKEQDSSSAQKVEDGSTQGANTDENQNGTVEKKDEKDAQGNKEQQTNPSVENQQNDQGNTGLTPSVPMVTVPDGQTPQGLISDVLAQDTGTIINQLGEQQLAPAKKIAEVVKKNGSEVAGPLPLPTKTKKYTVLRSVHVNKDSREQFEMRIHRRFVEIKNSSQQIIGALSSLSLPSGVGIEIKQL